MLGAIAGDFIGSVWEKTGMKKTNFQLWGIHNKLTDDSILTIAVADALLNGKSYEETLRQYGKEFPNAGYGSSFKNWLSDETSEPYRSWGNGSAMRVSPVAYKFDLLEQVLEEAEKSALPTHNHDDGIKGAKAVASAIFLARKGFSKAEIKEFIESNFTYNLSRNIDDIRPKYAFDVSCEGSVPEAIICFLEGTSFENTIRLAVSLGGDADTMASIAGAIAEPFYKEIPENITKQIWIELEKINLDSLVQSFIKKYVYY
jgi:ADP-ribosyl-[dinitrogen reductase] hydrolase